MGVEPLTEPGLGGSGRLGAGGVPPMGGPFEEQGHADETVVDNLGQAHKTEAHAQAWKNVFINYVYKYFQYLPYINYLTYFVLNVLSSLVSSDWKIFQQLFDVLF